MQVDGGSTHTGGAGAVVHVDGGSTHTGGADALVQVAAGSTQEGGCAGHSSCLAEAVQKLKGRTRHATDRTTNRKNDH